MVMVDGKVARDTDEDEKDKKKRKAGGRAEAIDVRQEW